MKKRSTTSEYLQFIGYSQASLEEVKGDIRDCLSDGFIKSLPGDNLLKTGIDLGIFKGKFKGENLRDNNSFKKPLNILSVKGEPDNPGHPYCQPLKNLKPLSLTYEIFLELTNKTDWLLRKLVGSLEEKLIAEKRGYEIARAKARDTLNWKR